MRTVRELRKRPTGNDATNEPNVRGSRRQLPLWKSCVRRAAERQEFEFTPAGANRWYLQEPRESE
jgi:hypothetical protein